MLEFDFPALLPSLAFFLLVYLSAYFVVFRRHRPEFRKEAASCFISLAHGTPVAAMAIFSLSSEPQFAKAALSLSTNPKNFPESFPFAGPNTPFQAAILDYSIAYFLVDILHYLIFFPSDVLFIGHHVATIFVLATCRYLTGYGAPGILSLLILAELTSACQNTWTLARLQRAHSKMAAKVYDSLTPAFYFVYTLVRGFMGPYFMYKMGVFYFTGGGDGVIPRWVSLSWVVVVVTAISVSALWISNLWVEFYLEKLAKVKEVKKDQ
ncbi:hypothetical protein AMTRI_Chr06g177840 [Amborella trichopoda]|uniref:TLC domain-containing protein n=1 Tax=Amborella trichopoda TaxID=13333 RepID=U5D417_AMBTC|nr:TLC domain-containing protein At5g14285 [Amborella trichopoda]ERN20356.1 hypothetical protein AMTR_s00066p00202000 [Amborella trichopoda]|eukprot:XP_006858889.1 TLC domain-containing protein At5g14285 [Amborella trichopoda]